jgi:hypothetical protein
MGFLGDFKDIVRLLNEVLGMFRQLSVQGRQKDKDGGGVLPSSEKRRIAAGVQAFFERNYDLRYNVMKQTEEFRRKAPPGDPEALIGNPEPLIGERKALIGNPETVLLSYFVPAPRAKANFIRAVDVQQVLAGELKAADVPSIKTLTDALRTCRFPHGKINGIRGWYAQRLRQDGDI